MTSHFPSIQSFYSREVVSGGQGSSGPFKAGDGFTSSEVEAVINSQAKPFQPSRHYDVCPIVELQTGLHNYKITGRLVNFSSTRASYFFLVISDGTAVIAVKLYCNTSEYQPLLGQRITLWTTAISAGNQSEIGPFPLCSVATTIYPGRDGATHIQFHVDDAGSEEDRSLRHPLEASFEGVDHLPGLMTLKSFLASGYDVGTGKILVCVRSIGPRRSIASKKKEAILDLVEVGIYDDTANCVLKLWQDKIPSVKLWIPNQTILLISQAWCGSNDRTNHRAEIGIGYSSIVEIDPCHPEATWLHGKIRDMAKRESIIIPFPTNNWDLRLAMHGPNRTLYTLAELEDQVRNQDPARNFTGKLNVVVLEINLMDHWRKNSTYCTECCGIALYANRLTAICKNCDNKRDLFLNPRLLGSFLDESGMVSGKKLVWDGDAWSQFFFGTAAEKALVEHEQDTAIKRSWKDIATFNTDSLRGLESQLLYSRVTLTFGWSVELGRLCIIGVEW